MSELFDYTYTICGLIDLFFRIEFGEAPNWFYWRHLPKLVLVIVTFVLCPWTLALQRALFQLTVIYVFYPEFWNAMINYIAH